MATEGMLKSMEEFAVHDGPGARLIVFLKGCMLRCKWCQNPEAIKYEPEVWSLTGCEETVGEKITAEKLGKKILSYKVFFSRLRDGGVTISGGDPLFRPDFTAELLKMCKNEYVHTAVESCLYASYENVWKVVSLCDVLICDLKHMDSDKHKEGTGMPNELILENFKRLNEDFEGEVHLHMPLIPGFNDDEENVRKTLDFVKPLDKVRRIDLLPFNIAPISKYEALGLKWEYGSVETQSREYLLKLKEIAESYNRFVVSIGGLL